MASMSISEATLLGFAAALGSGLLIGIERERRKGTGPARALGGVRTFALTALAGAVAKALQEPRLITVGALLIGALAVVAYWRRRGSDPGVTTGVALILTYLLG
ncbi:MAG: MgtC/SapB family protein, partial [Gammaproteobacteria bacterium]|nr:MgtC/SapB family protein [Gammaproteobacteria bacterium]